MENWSQSHQSLWCARRDQTTEREARLGQHSRKIRFKYDTRKPRSRARLLSLFSLFLSRQVLSRSPRRPVAGFSRAGEVAYMQASHRHGNSLHPANHQSTKNGNKDWICVHSHALVFFIMYSIAGSPESQHVWYFNWILDRCYCDNLHSSHSAGSIKLKEQYNMLEVKSHRSAGRLITLTARDPTGPFHPTRVVQSGN